MSWFAETDGDGRGGFVLLEAVIALAIIGLVAIGVLAAVGSQLRAADRATVMLTARALAEDRMVAIRLQDYDDLASLPDSLQAGRFAPPLDRFRWRAVVRPVEDEYDLFSAEVVVTTMSGDEAYPLRTMIHRPRPVIQAEGDR